MLSRPARVPWRWHVERHVCRIHLLGGQNARRVAKPPFVQGPAKGCSHAVSRIGQNTAEASTGSTHTIKLGKRDLVLGAKADSLGHTGLLAPIGIIRPRLGQVKPKRDGHGDLGQASDALSLARRKEPLQVERGPGALLGPAELLEEGLEPDVELLFPAARRKHVSHGSLHG